MMTVFFKGAIYSSLLMVGAGAGMLLERGGGVAVRERAAAIDACAREANVYPESCAMKAVVVSPSAPLPQSAALLPPPVEGV